MEKKEFVTKNAKETEKFGANLAKETVKKSSNQKAVVLGLEGELGAGKTTFVKGFARSLGIKEKITSPTFVLMKNYRFKSENYNFLIHIDAYRLKDYRELVTLGIKEILDNPENIVLIEWSDRVKEILPKKYLKIHIDHIDEQTRKITLQLSP